MPQYVMAPSWNGYDDEYENHESTQAETEVKRLVKASLAFLPNGNYGPAGQHWIGLRNAFDSASATITITKGIHQRETDPHITISTTIFGGKIHAYHINVRAKNAQLNPDGTAAAAADQRFAWKVVQVSTEVEKNTYFYPPAVEPVNVVGRPRGRSFTDGQLSTHINSSTKAKALSDKAALEAAQKAVADQKAAAALGAQMRASHVDLKAKGLSPWGTPKQ